jgi:SCY1-like protein 2
MGNELGKKYDIPQNHTATAGLCQLFKLYPVTPKEGSVTDELTLWLMQKDDLTMRATNPITDKTTLERIFQVMRKDINAAKDMSHSGLVKVIDVLEDNKKAFAFVTERILCSLADFLNQFSHIPGGFSFHQNYLEPNGTILEAEISRGFLNIVEGLQYMHNVQKKLHLNISPESIVMTPSGQWKLCGFGFALSFQSGDDMKIPSPYFMNNAPTAMRLEPDLRYCAPEMTEGGPNYQDVRYVTRACDVFSLGLVGYEMYRYNMKLAAEGRTNTCPVQMSGNSVAQHYEAMHTALRSLDLSCMPPGFSQLLTCMIQDNPTARISLLDIGNNAFFLAGSLATLKSVDTIYQRDMGTQASILSQLPGQLGGFPPRMLECAVLPGLCRLTKENPMMWSYSLPVHIFIAARINSVAYQRATANAFIEGLAEDNVDVIQAFIRNMDHLRNSFEVNFFRCYVVPMICNALDKPLSSLLVS